MLLGKDRSVIKDSYPQAQSLLRSDPLFFELVERLRQIVSYDDPPI
jgi:hypothetical protein